MGHQFVIRVVKDEVSVACQADSGGARLAGVVTFNAVFVEHGLNFFRKGEVASRTVPAVEFARRAHHGDSRAARGDGVEPVFVTADAALIFARSDDRSGTHG